MDTSIHEDTTGAGLKIKHKNLYIPKHKFNNGILEVRYKKNKHLIQELKPLKMGKGLQNAIYSKLVNNKDLSLNSLSQQEKRVYDMLLKKFGHKVDNSEYKEIHNKFEVLIGEINSGNDNPKIKQQLRSLLIYCMKTHILTRDQVLEYFLEYNL